MITLSCPRLVGLAAIGEQAPCEADLRFSIHVESDGFGVYSNTWLSAELESQDCEHQFTEEEMTVLIDAAVEVEQEREPDYDYEPYFDAF